MGVCCIVLDIDGMLFEFFMNFLNIGKNKKFRIFFLNYHVFFAFYAISNIFRKTLLYYFILHFMLFSTLKKIEILKSAPSLTG